MVGNADDIARRLAALPADKRALLEQRLSQLRAEPKVHGISMTQQGLWFLDQMTPGSPQYVLGWTIEFEGPLDFAAFEAAVKSLIDRHGVLRTRFATIDGAPVQVVLPEVPSAVPRDDFRDVDESGMAAKVEVACTTEVNAGFDLAVAPLIRFRLLSFSAGRNVVLLVAHHIVFDWLSLDILLTDLAKLYAAHTAGNPLPDKPALQFADFSDWQRNRLQGPYLQKLLNYWRGQLAGGPEVLELPTDRPRPAVQSHAGGEYFARLGADLSAQLKQLATAEHATLFVVMLAAFQVLLSRVTGQQDIAVGSSVSGRVRKEFEPIIGYFVNAIVLRADLSGNPGFRDLVRQVRQTCLQAYDHQELPFEQLVQELRPQRSLSYNPLFQVYFGAIHESDQYPSFAGLQIKSVKNLEVLQTSKFDLSLAAVTSGAQIELGVGYSTDLFDVSTVARLVSRFQVLLAAVAANPDVPIAQIDLLLPGERETLTTQHHGATHPPAQRTLHSLIEAHAATTPHKPAVICGTTQLTYRELNEQANHLAHTLITAGAAPDTLIGVALPRSPGLIVTLLAVLKAGAGYIALDPAHPPARLARIIGDAHPPCVISDPATAAALTTTSTPILVPQPPSPDTLPAITPAVPVSPRNLAYTIYTSGSTGQPKPVAVEHTQVVHLLAAARAEFGFGAEDIWASFQSSSADFPPWETWGALAHGGKLVIVPDHIAGSSGQLRQLLASQRVTVLYQEAPEFYEWAGVTGTGGLPLRLVMLHGDLPPARQVAAWPGHPDVKVFSACRVPEVAGDVVRGQITPTGFVPASPGQAADVQVYVQDQQGRLAPIGVPGELYAGGAAVSRGYPGRAALTAERFVPDPYGPPGGRLFRVGAGWRWRAAGDLEYCGAPGRAAAVGVTQQNGAVVAQDGDAAYESPVTVTEQLIAEIWAEVLELAPVGRNDNFFVTGHSLLAVKAIALTREMFQVDVPLSTLFEAPTPALFARALATHFPSPDALDALSSSIRDVLTLSDTEVQERLSATNR